MKKYICSILLLLSTTVYGGNVFHNPVLWADVPDPDVIRVGSDYYMVRPGITGMWQVNGRSDTTYDERVRMDSWYVRNWSVWLDAALLSKTFSAVVKGKGAY